MKHIRLLTRLLVFAWAFLLLLSTVATAAPQDAAAAAVAAPPSPLWLSLIPVGVPLLVMVIKGFLPGLPKGCLPVIAAGVGLALAILDHFTGTLGGNPMAVLFLGAAGTGLREIGDQLKKAATA